MMQRIEEVQGGDGQRYIKLGDGVTMPIAKVSPLELRLIRTINIMMDDIEALEELVKSLDKAKKPDKS